MNSQSHRTVFTAALGVALGAVAGNAVADTISYDHVPLSNVVAQLGRQYGVSIVLKGALAQNPERAVTLNIGDANTTLTRLQVINSLANAARVDFQKGIVVSKIASDDVPPPVKIDSNGFVIFKNKTVPVRDAIAAVAGTDNATIQVGDDVTGDVTFPKTTMRAADAADVIARQTHTRWRVYYALMPYNMAQRGKVVGRTSEGHAIVELPFSYYDTSPRTTPATQTASGAQGNPPNTPGNPALAVPADSSNPVIYAGPNANGPVGFGTVAGGAAVSPYSYVPSFGYGGQMPFNYGNGYGYTGYGAPYPTQYGYFGGGYPGNANNGITTMPGAGNYGPFGGYGAPVTF